MDIDNDKRHLGMKMKEIQELYEKMNDHKLKCSCSHTMFMPNKRDRMCCNHCGRWVYKDKKTEYKYKMREMLLNDRC